MGVAMTMATLPFDAILFDLDGTLIDTDAVVQESWRRVAAELSMPFDVFAPFIHGVPAPEVLERVAPHLDSSERGRIARRVLDDQARPDALVAPQPSALDLLAQLAATPWGIVTSGDSVLATTNIRKSKLPAPRTLITADDVRRGKPDPEPYLLAAQRFDAAPARCLVVEDSPAGVASALAASMPVVAVCTTHEATELDSATWVISDLTALTARSGRCRAAGYRTGALSTAPR